MKCNKCGLDQRNQMQFICGLCWKCFQKHAGNLPEQLVMAMIKDGVQIK